MKRLGVARTEARHAATVDVTALLNAADRLRSRDMLVLIAATEMPRGEALALRWTDIDLDAGLVDRAQHPRAHRRQARGVRTQDRRSRRSALRWWRCCGRAASSKPPNGCTPGDQRTDCGLVFATEFGTPVEPRILVRTIETAARKAGVEEVWVHIGRGYARALVERGPRRQIRPNVRPCGARGGQRNDWDTRTMATGQVTNRTGRLAAVTAMTPGRHRRALTRLGRIFVVEPGDQFLLDTVRFDYSTRQADRYGYRCRRNDQPKRKIEEPSLQQQRRQHWPEKTPQHPLPISLFTPVYEFNGL